MEKQLETNFTKIQNELIPKISLKNTFDSNNIKLLAGVDLAYWQEKEIQYAVCCIVVTDYNTKQVVEKVFETGKIEVPYIAGFLAFRELPLIKKTVALLQSNPDIFLFDGNGYLHYRHMGIATHASFHINKPTIGIAKSYLKIKQIEFTMPEIEPLITKVTRFLFHRSLHNYIVSDIISTGLYLCSSYTIILD